MREQEININIFAGPGVGKSTVGPGLFNKMKKQGFKVEFVSEYAKDLTYGKDYTKLRDQLLVFSNQFHRYFRLIDHDIDYLIHESPNLMSLVYFKETDLIPEKEFKNLALAIFKNTKTINIFLERNPKYPYQAVGRNQSLEEAKELDFKILKLLIDNDVQFHKMLSDDDAEDRILQLIKDLKG
jgi:hypothetical protein